jgi:hypothetical protein
MELNHQEGLQTRFGFRAISHNINCKQGRGNASCDPPCSIS